MLQRVPGFVLDYGSGARGLEGSGGNVLIDGQRPASKADNIAAILTRIPAANVERIDLIRGGAPGIDMQGKAVVANVILRKSARPQGEAEARTSRRPRGGPVADLALRGSGPVRGGTLEGSFTYGRGFSGLLGDGVGRTSGPMVRSRISPSPPRTTAMSVRRPPPTNTPWPMEPLN